MAYRSPDEALRERAAELDAEIAAADARIAALSSELQAVERETAAVRERLQEAGPAAGPRGAVRDRVGLAGIVLAVAGALTAPLHLSWNHYVGRDNTVVPAIVMLATPGILAVLVTWPYRDVSAPCRWAFLAGAIVTAAPFVNLALGFFLEAR
jgi:hypothetical protein